MTTVPLLWVAIRHIVLVLSLLTTIGLLAVACGGSSTPSSTATTVPRVQVVTTTPILADFARNVGGDRVEVRSIVPPGADVHSFQPTPKESIAISNARVIVSNGLGLDAFLDSLLKSAKRSEAVHVIAADGLDATPMKVIAFPPRAQGDENESSGHIYSEGDPHLWHNPQYAIYYVERIRDGLIQADTAGAQVYRDNATGYIQKLNELDEEIAETLSAVPPQRRHLVTFHDAFGYFAERYGWEVSAFAPDDASDVTPGAVVRVMEPIKEEGIPVIYAEPQFNPDVLNQAARDAGVSIGLIYSDVLDTEVPTYIEMMRFNAKSLLRLQQQPGG